MAMPNDPGQNGPAQHDPEQVDPMQRLVDLSIERTKLAQERTEMAADRSRMSADRSRMSADRSEMSAERSYLAAERTLSVWIRTALALMIFGLAIDRFGLLLRQMPARRQIFVEDTVSTWGGSALVALGVLMVVVTSIRFRAYAVSYRRTHTIPAHHGPFMAPLFALLVAIFGIGLLVLLLAVS